MERAQFHTDKTKPHFARQRGHVPRVSLPWLQAWCTYFWCTTCILYQCATFIPSFQISHLPRLRQEFQRGASGLPGLNARSCVPVEPRIELDNVKEKCVKVNRRKVEIATVTLVVSRAFYKSNNQSMMDLKLLGTWRSDHVRNLLFHAFIAGRWSDWSVWSECSKTCGSGRNTRSRTCEERSCVGTVTQERSCNTFACFLTSKHILWSTITWKHI